MASRVQPKADVRQLVAVSALDARVSVAPLQVPIPQPVTVGIDFDPIKKPFDELTRAAPSVPSSKQPLVVQATQRPRVCVAITSGHRALHQHNLDAKKDRNGLATAHPGPSMRSH